MANVVSNIVNLDAVVEHMKDGVNGEDYAVVRTGKQVFPFGPWDESGIEMAQYECDRFNAGKIDESDFIAVDGLVSVNG